MSGFCQLPSLSECLHSTKQIKTSYFGRKQKNWKQIMLLVLMFRGRKKCGPGFTLATIKQSGRFVLKNRYSNNSFVKTSGK